MQCQAAGIGTWHPPDEEKDVKMWFSTVWLVCECSPVTRVPTKLCWQPMNCPVTDWGCIPGRQYSPGLSYGFSPWPGDRLSYGQAESDCTKSVPSLAVSTLHSVGRTAKDTSAVRASNVYQEGLAYLHNIHQVCSTYTSVLMA